MLLFFYRRIFCTGFPVRENKFLMNLLFFFLFAVAVIENCYTFAIQFCYSWWRVIISKTFKY